MGMSREVIRLEYPDKTGEVESLECFSIAASTAVKF